MSDEIVEAEPTATKRPAVATAFARVSEQDDHARRRVRALLMDAYIAARNLNGGTATSPDDIGKLDLMFKHLTGEEVTVAK